ncbi:MAG: CDGSH iron-sulfur domain-containing protein [candidate division WOR-3 bacterium]
MIKIEFLENGPYKVEIENESFLIEKDGKQEKINKKVIYLCRCGNSNNKPFCDGAHSKIGFKANGGLIKSS